MEEPRRSCDDQEKNNNIVIKMSGGGGIGAIILIGGVLATAALTSVFVVSKKDRSSGKDRRRRHQNPPPELDKQTEEDCLDTSSDVHNHPSVSEATKEVEREKDNGLLISTESLILDEKPRIEANERILSSISPNEAGNDSVSDGSVIITDDSHSLDEELPFDHKNTMHEEKIQSTEEDITIEPSKQSINFEQEEIAKRETISDGDIQDCKESVELTEMKPIEEEHTEVCCDQEESEVGVDVDHMEEQKSLHMEVKIEEKELEGCFSDDGDMSEEKCEETIDETEEDVAKIVLELGNGNQEAVGTGNSVLEAIASESHTEDWQKAICPVFETSVIEQETVNGDEKEGVISTESVEISQEDEGNEGFEKDETGNVVEQLVKENEKFDPLGEGIVPGKCGLQIIVQEEKIPSENRQFGEIMPKEGLGSPEMAKDGGENEEIDENLEIIKSETLVKDHEDDDERNISKEVEEELISSQDIAVEEDDESNEEVSEIREVNENESLLPEDDEVEVEVNPIKQEIEESLETIDTNNNGGIMKMGEHDINDYNDEADETDLSEEVNESSVETGDSSMESMEEAAWPAESLSLEPQLVKLIHQEVQGKIQEDKSVNRDSSLKLHKVREEESNPDKSNENFTIMADSSKLKKSFIEKYKVDLATVKILHTNSTGRRMIIGILSVLSSLSCSWFFGLSFVKLCLILFFTMVLSEIHGY
ncbi:hypothetical protein BUALT_Bualt02G0237700 [Buddleja alternifolia]|uniref:Uncharacterized protein n=1 Tax=Buddleja alternifolia TaxID=168488 RepID=A0AAV6Y4Z1_9LAMI|nr:hypothetical protein BUALT_Bualt02G0237700 [Buddleja alternifolia]